MSVSYIRALEALLIERNVPLPFRDPDDARVVDFQEELRNIANAKRFDRNDFRDDTEFADWAQSRARHALAADTPSNERSREDEGRLPTHVWTCTVCGHAWDQHDDEVPSACPKGCAPASEPVVSRQDIEDALLEDCDRLRRKIDVMGTAMKRLRNFVTDGLSSSRHPNKSELVEAIDAALSFVPPDVTPKIQGPCEWTPMYSEDAPEEAYSVQSGCGHEWMGDDDGDPPGRWIKFCPFCGNAAKFVPLDDAPKVGDQRG